MYAAAARRGRSIIFAWGLLSSALVTGNRIRLQEPLVYARPRAGMDEGGLGELRLEASVAQGLVDEGGPGGSRPRHAAALDREGGLANFGGAAGSLLDATGARAMQEEGAGLIPFLRIEPEAVLSADAFRCHAGKVRSVNLPMRSRGRGVKHFDLIFQARILQHINLYADNADDRRQFLIIPPVDGYSCDWRLLTRTWQGISHGMKGWSGDRVFSITGGNPCGRPLPAPARDTSGAVGNASVL